MKLIIFTICVCLVQICLSAPAASSDDSSELNDSDIQEIHDTLTQIPGLRQQAVDDFTDIVKKFRKNATDNEVIQATLELLSLALQGDVEDKKAIDLKQLLETSSSEEDSKSKEGGKTMDGLTESDLKEMEDELTKVLTPKQKQHAMKILRSFREGAPEKENEAAVQDLIISALEALVNGATVKISRTETNTL